MGRPYSRDLRGRAGAAVLAGGLSRRKAAAHFAVGSSTAINWLRRFRETGSVLPVGGHKPKAIVDEHRAWLLLRIKEKDFTLRGLVVERAGRCLKVDDMMDIGSHKGKSVRRAFREAGAKLFFLPKYAPNLNPNEQVFAKLKHLLRKEAPRTVDSVVASIGALLGTFPPQECANYFKKAGYGSTQNHPALMRQ